MVRLKEEEINSALVRANIFQFHYGSVKRMGVFGVISGALEFQFHYGSVKSRS